MTRRRAIMLALLALAGGAGLYFGLSAITGLAGTWERVRRGDPAWLGLAVALEIASFWGHIVLFRAVFAGGEHRIGWSVAWSSPPLARARPCSPRCRPRSERGSSS